MRAIIIGAGRGRRLMPTTADTPKCYAEVQGRRLLDWALQAFAGAGLRDICFIGGYQIERVRRHYPHFPFRAHGEYTGIARFTPAGAAQLRQHYHQARASHAGKPFREAALFEKAYLIQLFQHMIEAGVKMSHADTPGHYMEVDTQQDFDLARK